MNLSERNRLKQNIIDMRSEMEELQDILKLRSGGLSIVGSGECESMVDEVLESYVGDECLEFVLKLAESIIHSKSDDYLNNDLFTVIKEFTQDLNMRCEEVVNDKIDNIYCEIEGIVEDLS